MADPRPQSPLNPRFILSCRLLVWGVLTLLIGFSGLSTPHAQAQAIDLSNRPIHSVTLQGIERVSERLVRNQIRSTPGDPYNPEAVEGDIQRITFLGQFDSVRAEVQPQADGSVALIYIVSEWPLITDVQVVGNKAISDAELGAEILLQSGDPMDPFLIEQAELRIRAAYEKKGYFIVNVSSEQQLLEDTGILIFRIREGPKVKLRRIEFEGNDSYPRKLLQSRIRAKTYFPIFSKGEVSREQMDQDAQRIQEFYQSEGYLDAQVGRRIDISADEKQASVVFQISEGRKYRVESIRIIGVETFSDRQVIETLSLKVGDTFSQEKRNESTESLRDMYGRLGFLESRIAIRDVFHETEPLVQVLVQIDEGQPYTVGRVTVRGNRLTQDKVILRQVRGITPGRRFDRSGVERTERRLSESALFSEANVTVLGDPEDEVRDVLIEVEEQNTGSISFGAGVSSDAGLVGAIELTQRNFDIADTPESFGEMVSGRAFRGAGQFFSMQVSPGDEVSSYSINFREPYLFESQYFLTLSGFLFERERDDYDEERLGGRAGIGQRFGDIYTASVNFRHEQVELSDIEPTAPTDVFALAGENTIASVGLTLQRNTVDSGIFPTRGSRTSATIERYGALGGDFDFTRLNLRFTQFWTVDEDFLGRKSVLKLRTEVGNILEDDESPTFERFYAGGHRSFRGFEFRGVGPRGIRNDDPTRFTEEAVGGDFMFLMSLEYNVPVFQEVLRWVVFTDTGTVDTSVNFTKYRVSVGTGMRFQIPFLGQAPVAIDIAVPLRSEDTDLEQLVSFDLALPLQ